jgi:hypothetical protein
MPVRGDLIWRPVPGMRSIRGERGSHKMKNEDFSILFLAGVLRFIALKLSIFMRNSDCSLKNWI